MNLLTCVLECFGLPLLIVGKFRVTITHSFSICLEKFFLRCGFPVIFSSFPCLFMLFLQDCSVSGGGGEVIVRLMKTHRAFWPRVTLKKTRFPFLAVDYNRWMEESSCSSSEEDEGC